jgi:class I fructose-bisphosphate aldolase
MGRAGLINSGGAAGGDTDLSDAVRTAVINKRAGGMGLILGVRRLRNRWLTA